MGVVEAPRGTLFHHYETDEKGLITKANMVVATGNNAARIAMSVERAAKGLIKGGQVTEGLLNKIEMAFRAYDPCLGCATHSLPRASPFAREHLRQPQTPGPTADPGLRNPRCPMSASSAAGLPHATVPGSSPCAARLLVLGLGNDILTDDAVGLLVTRELQQKVAGYSGIDVRQTSEMGLALFDFIAGYSAVIIIDAIQTGQEPPGFIHELDAASLKELKGGTPHFLGVGETLALGRHLGLPMPSSVRILAIEVEDPRTLGTEMTPALRSALPSIVDDCWSRITMFDF